MRWDILGQRSSNGQDTRDYFSTRVTMSSRTLTQPGLMQASLATVAESETVQLAFSTLIPTFTQDLELASKSGNFYAATEAKARVIVCSCIAEEIERGLLDLMGVRTNVSILEDCVSIEGSFDAVTKLEKALKPSFRILAAIADGRQAIRVFPYLSKIPASAPPAEYHQTHTAYGLPACPLCGWKSLVMRSRPKDLRNKQTWGTSRCYYTACEHEECEGLFEGPTRDTAQEAGNVLNERLKRFSASFQRGDGGEW